MSLLTTLIVKNINILAGIYFIFPKKHRRLNLKGFQCQISASVKRLRKYLSSKADPNTFLHISCSNFRLKLCETPPSYKHCQTNEFGRGLGRVKSKKLFAETTIDKILETNSSFYVKQRTTGKVQIRFFSRFLLTLTKFSFWQEDWARCNNCMKF